MLQRIWSHGRSYTGAFAVGLVLLLGTNGLALWIPWLLRDAIHGMEAGAALAEVASYALAIVAVAIVQAAVRTLSRLTVLGASRKVVYDVRERFFAHLQRLGATFYDANRTGDIMSRGVNDLQLIRSLYGPGLLNLFNTAIIYVATMVLLVKIDFSLTLVSLSVFPFLFLAANRISKRVYARSLAVQEQLAVLSNRAQENLSGIQQVKIYAQEDRETEGFRKECDEFRRRNLAMAFLRGGMISMIGVVTGIGTLVVLFVGGSHVIEGKITFGDFVAFNAYLGLLTWPTIALGWIVNVFQRGAGALERIHSVLETVPDIPVDVSAAAEVPPVDGDIEIRGLSFAYRGGDGEEAPLASLRGIDLTIARGSRVAIVGPVGSGKSTLVNLLARVYPVPRGTIFIGGVDINDIPVTVLRRSLGYVPQEAFLFSRSIRENIALGRPDASDEEVFRSIALAGLDRDIDDFPGGIDTVVGERGFTLSGGQRQRATLARAALVEPRILILDDSLSSVDADTEKNILDELRGGMRDRTSILISHRVSTLVDMDRIVVLDEGRIVEEGTHADLMARKGLYAKLFRRHLLEERLEAS